jgi:LmbE family N-acetylglucosaminyl deacetylase
MRRYFLALALLLVLCFDRGAPAQLRPQPVGELPGNAAMTLMLRRLASTGTFMQTSAHPDDEDNALLAMFSHGQGLRTVLVSATRGDGGQNEIGPELFQALGVLRTEELLAVHRFDGGEQYFTRAVDFGYSFSVEETFEKWGRDEIVGDFVRLIRATRPDVIAGFLCGGEGGGQHHQASTRLTAEAFKAAGDPSRYPEQIEEGLRPWRARRLFCTDFSGFGTAPQKRTADLLTAVTTGFDPALGRTYAELGLEARSMHKCQGTSQLLLLPGAGSNRTYRLMDSIGGDPGIAPASMFEDIDTTIPGLARFAPSLAATLSPSLKAIAARITEATAAFESKGPAAAAPALAAGLANVRALRSRLKSGNGISADAFEVEFRLAQKETQFQQALVLASGARLESLASDGLVIPGQTVEIASYVSNQAAEPITVRNITVARRASGAQSCGGSVHRGQAFSCKGQLVVPSETVFSTPYWKPRTDAARYDFAPGVPFGVPFTPTPFTTTFELTIAGADISIARPVEYRYDHVVAGEKRMELQVVPPFAMTMTPAIAVVPAAAAARRTVEVTVTNHTTGAVSADVSLRVPAGWRSEPESAPVKFSREDEQAAVSFVVVPPAGLKSGEHQVSALVRSGSLQSTVGYEVVEYPHIRRRHVVQPAEARLKVIDVAIAANLRVGYIMGVGDQVPPAIEQLGAEVHQITPKELASGDLSRYHTIVTGVRAYERRPDLRANNHRLLSYASNGGTVLVQYNKFEFNEAQYAPYPAKVSSGRVTDENSVVEILVPDHPAFTRPNRIGEAAWKGWVQERGLYFLGERDPAYRDLIRLEDPFPLNKGSKTGALVEAKVNKGRWIYIGLGLWRQLPAGADGAYQLMANLLSLGSLR